MLCEPKWKIGLLGSMYFIGVIVGMTFVPPLADAFGRKIIFIVTLIISVFAQLGLILTNNLYEAYVYQFFIGSTFAGRVIVGLNYMLEFVIPSWHQAIIFWLLISECISTILMTAYVQFIDKCWFSLQLICFILAILTLGYFWILVPESPKWQYTWKIFDKARKSLTMISSFNSNEEYKQRRL